MRPRPSGIGRAAAGWIGGLALAAAVLGCSSGKAVVDYSWQDGIIWPGPPERPRISYQWSMSQISTSDLRGSFMDFIAGDEERGDDPRMSRFMATPQGLSTDSKGRLYVADTGAGRVVSVNMKSLEHVIFDHGPDFSVVTPVAAVADSKGNVYISDASLARVCVFSDSGRFQRFLDGSFSRPTGLALDEQRGRLYVTDTWEHTIYVYDLEGRRTGSIGHRGEGPGEFNYPTHLFADRDGNLYVSDTLNFRVQAIGPDGAHLFSIGLHGDSYADLDKAKGVAVDSAGHIYVTDSRQDMIKIFDRQGRLLLFFGEAGFTPGRFMLPTGIFIDGSDNIYVSDSLNGRVQVFKFLGGD